jgi:hypothetical protein
MILIGGFTKVTASDQTILAVAAGALWRSSVALRWIYGGRFVALRWT